MIHFTIIASATKRMNMTIVISRRMAQRTKQQSRRGSSIDPEFGHS